MPRQRPSHPVLSSRVAAAEEGADYSGLRVNYRGAFHARRRQPTLAELQPHTLFLGATGCGKTTAVKLHMRSVLPIEDERFSMRFRSLIYDPKSDMLPYLGDIGFDPDTSVILTNPFDKRSACWDIAADVSTDADARSFAEVVVHDHPGQEFWQTSAKDIVTSTISGLNQRSPGAWDLRDLVLVIDTPALLAQVLKRTAHGKGVLRDYINTDKRLSGSIRATVRSNLEPYRLIAALWDHAHYSFSFSKWSTGAGCILIGDHYKYHRAMKRVNNLLVRYAIDSVMDRPGEEHRDLTWLYLDELKNAGRFPNFGTMLTQGRSKGIRAVLAAQGLSTLQATFPEAQEKEVVNNCGNKCIMQLGSDEDASWAERLFSTTERERISHTIPDDPADRRRSSKTFTHQRESLLEAKTFLTMPSANTHGRAIAAYYHEPGGVFSQTTVPGEEVIASLGANEESGIEPYSPRPPEQVTLREFDDRDLRHLGLTLVPDDEQAVDDGHPSETGFRMPPPVAQ